jgi:hypothetical protein
MSYDLSSNLSTFEQHDNFSFLTFNNQATIILESPLGNTKYQVMQPSIKGMSYFGATDLDTGKEDRFTPEKWTDLSSIVSPYSKSHPVVDLENEIHDIHQEMIEPLGLKEISIRPWKNMAITGALTVTYPISLVIGSLYLCAVDKIKPDAHHHVLEGIAALALMPLAFAGDIKETIKPSNHKYKINNPDYLRTEGSANTPKISLCDLNRNHLPRLYFPNGVELLHQSSSSKPLFGSYEKCEFYIEIDQDLQHKLFSTVDRLESERKKLHDFSEKLDTNQLKILVQELIK